MIELRLAEAVAGPASRPERVTAVLSAMFRTIGSQEASPDMARSLCAAGRERLLQRAADLLRPSLSWFETRCAICHQPYDLSLSLQSAGRTDAGSGFPVVEVETSLGRRWFEAPNGFHEEAWAHRAQGAQPGTLHLDPRRFFAAACALADEAEEEAARFDENDLARIDSRLEAVSPDIADSVVSTCPNCGEQTGARLEPMAFGFPSESDILRDVHLLASAYSWPEERILALPAHRRGTYSALVVQERRTAASASWRPL
jgi:hypothetical protein